MRRSASITCRQRPSSARWNPRTVWVTMRSRTMVTAMRVPPRSTVIRTGTPASPMSISTHSSGVLSAVETPSISTMRSPARTPAAIAGEPSRGVMTVSHPSRIATATPIPTYSPVISFSNSSVSAGGT